MEVGLEMSREGPDWLPAFLEKDYFSHCKQHNTSKNEKNMFCIDCGEGPLCMESLKDHPGHQTLQVRKASHVNGIRISDIHKLVDVSYIQTYVINSSKIVFLPSRPQEKPNRSPCYCDICHRGLQDQVRFCSIMCKLKAVLKFPEDSSITLSVNSAKPGNYSAGRTSSTYNIYTSNHVRESFSGESSEFSVSEGPCPSTTNSGAISKGKRPRVKVDRDFPRTPERIFKKYRNDRVIRPHSPNSVLGALEMMGEFVPEASGGAFLTNSYSEEAIHDTRVASMCIPTRPRHNKFLLTPPSTPMQEEQLSFRKRARKLEYPVRAPMM